MSDDYDLPRSTAAQDVRDAAAWLTSPSAGGGRDWYSADAQAKLAAHAARLRAAADRLDRFERGTANIAATDSAAILAAELTAFGGLRAIRLRLEQLEWPASPRHPDLLNRDIYGAKGIPPDPPALLDDGTGTWHGNTYVPGGADAVTYLVRPGIDYPRSAEELAPPVLRSRRRRRPWFVR